MTNLTPSIKPFPIELIWDGKCFWFMIPWFILIHFNPSISKTPLLLIDVTLYSFLLDDQNTSHLLVNTGYLQLQKGNELCNSYDATEFSQNKKMLCWLSTLWLHLRIMLHLNRMQWLTAVERRVCQLWLCLLVVLSYIYLYSFVPVTRLFTRTQARARARTHGRCLKICAEACGARGANYRLQ